MGNQTRTSPIETCPDCARQYLLVGLMVSKLKIALITAIVVVAAVAVFISHIQANPVPVNYWMEKKDSFAEGLVPWTIYCENVGQTSVDCYLDFTLENMTGPQGPTLINHSEVLSIVKVRLTLSPRTIIQKTAYFSINENESGYLLRLTVSLEKINFWDSLNATGIYPSRLNYDWNSTNETYVCLPWAW